MGLLMFGGLALFSLGTFAFGRGLPGWVFAKKNGRKLHDNGRISL